ncbi:hypothetical protein [Halomicronema sp. CCY15110]|uniref:hypothetical protein n=1 Tax=Halomicronema sp. CCY15110 TaxID=2767773 RepID=UPI00194E892F|nr:hypothetical protein [Halomicronema sp. CCY15110]
MSKAKKKPYPQADTRKERNSKATRVNSRLSAQSSKAVRKKSTSTNGKPTRKILDFFAKFHGWDFIFAPAKLGKLSWQTYKRNHPLSAASLYRRWADPEQVIGVRFQSNRYGEAGTTQYLMLDIDIGSAYHPANNHHHYAGILNALQQIGLFDYILICSSSSGGLHVYYPLPDSVSCFRLALAIREQLTQERFTVQNGQLEIFPNVKRKGSNYQAHRLPLQIGSYVLGQNFEPLHRDLDRFIDTWNKVSAVQDMELLNKKIAQAKPTWDWSKSHDALTENSPTQWKADLEGIMATGWTRPGQTNFIIQKLLQYARIFLEMEWDEVGDWAIQQVPTLPGFKEFCGHQNDYQRRVREWVATNRKHNRYYPYSQRQRKAKPVDEPKGPDNDDKAQAALSRIQQAIARIHASPDGMPNGVKARQVLICQEAQCSAQTLRKYLHLWHPQHERNVPDAETATDQQHQDCLHPSGAECVTPDLACA